jgi:hypothetical protein
MELSTTQNTRFYGNLATASSLQIYPSGYGSAPFYFSVAGSTVLNLADNGATLVTQWTPTTTAFLRDIVPFTSGTGASLGSSSGPIRWNTAWLKDLDVSGAFTFPTQSANKVFSGPTSGGAAVPAFRSLVAADIPDLTGTYPILGAPGITSDSGSGFPITRIEISNGAVTNYEFEHSPVASFGPAAVASITVVNGIITAIS